MPIQAPLVLKKQRELADEEEDRRAVMAVKVVVMLAGHVRHLEGGLDHSFCVWEA
jgi:hypothetical protein